MDTKYDCFGNRYKKKKYERQRKFNKRFIIESRNVLIKQLKDYKLSQSYKGYNFVILKHPLKDELNHSVITYKYEPMNLGPVKMKYIKLKMELVEDGKSNC